VIFGFHTCAERATIDATASITYSESASLTNNGFIDAYLDTDDQHLVPIVVEPMPPADMTIELEVIFDTMDDGTNRARFNDVTYNAPIVPTVFSALTLGQNANISSAYGPTSYVVDHMKVFDIVLKNGDAGKHPL
jgi:iron transport multicopper oxidase